MEPIQLMLGEVLDIRFLVSDEVYSAVSYTSSVEMIVEKDEYLISSPLDNDVDNFVGRKIKITVPRSNAAFWAEAEIIKKTNIGFTPLLHIKIISGFTKIQRREYYRLKIELDVNIEGLGNTKTVDISGNGLAILSEINFDTKEQIKGSLNIAGKEIPICGTIVRCQSASDKYNLVCVHLDDIDKQSQNEIIEFINKNKPFVSNEI